MEKENFIGLETYDDRFSDSSYLTEMEDEIWLSLIYVKKEFQGQGVFTKFLKELCKQEKKIIIPTPSVQVQSIAHKLGFYDDTIYLEDEGPCDVLIFKKQEGAKK